MTGAAPVILRPPLSDLRDYVHGADLFDALLDVTGAEEQAQLRLSRIAATPIALHHDRSRPQAADFCGLFDYRCGGTDIRSWLSLVPGEVIAQRAAAMDREAIAAARFGSGSATAIRQDRFSVAKTALVLAVALIERLLPEDALNLAEMRAAPRSGAGERIEVRIERRISHFLLVSVAADRRPWGQLTISASHSPSEAPSEAR